MQKTTKLALLAVLAVAGFWGGEELYAKNHQNDTNEPQIIIAENASGGVWDKTKDVTSDVWSGTKEVASDVWDGTKKVSSDVWDGTKEVGSDIKDGLSNDETTAKHHKDETHTSTTTKTN